MLNRLIRKRSGQRPDQVVRVSSRKGKEAAAWPPVNMDSKVCS